MHRKLIKLVNTEEKPWKSNVNYEVIKKKYGALAPPVGLIVEWDAKCLTDMKIKNSQENLHQVLWTLPLLRRHTHPLAAFAYTSRFFENIVETIQSPTSTRSSCSGAKLRLPDACEPSKISQKSIIFQESGERHSCEGRLRFLCGWALQPLPLSAR